MKSERRNDKRRITLDVSPEFYRRLENLERRVDAHSKAEVIREALQLYEFVADRQIGGWKFQARHRETQEVENLVFLDLPNQMLAD